jgi:hypothetical protein
MMAGKKTGLPANELWTNGNMFRARFPLHFS